jgi:hypothetical protein
LQLGQQIWGDISIVKFQRARKFLGKPSANPNRLHVSKRVKDFAPLGAVDLIVLFTLAGPTVRPALKSEMLHRRERLAEKIGNLCCDMYLRVEVPAVDIYGKVHPGPAASLKVPATKSPHMNLPRGELNLSAPKPDMLCCVDEPKEIWNGKHGFPEVVNVES